MHAPLGMAGKLRSLKYIAISAFLLFHIAAITCWCMPLNSPLIAVCRNAIRPYMLWSGLFQSWDMFAPQPKSSNSYIESVVIYKDGRTQTWKFPRMEHLGLGEQLYKERYRKFVENLQDGANAAFWPDTARYIARLNDDSSSPPQIVVLVRHWSDIPPRDEAAYYPQPWHAQIFYEYYVQTKDLK
jgi:hypothetical protein